MNIVAHQDDDIFFLNPAIQQAIDAGDCVVTVYLTAGDAGMGASYWQDREAGSEAAYRQMLAYAGFDTTADTDQAQVLTVRDSTRATHHLVAVSPSRDPRVTQVFLRLPDGLPNGTGSATYGLASLTRLWIAADDATASNGPAAPASQQVVVPSVDGANSYTAEGLVSTLAQLIVDFQPTVIQIQDDRLLPYHDASGNVTGSLFGAFCGGPTGPPDSAGPILSLADCSPPSGHTIDHADHIAGAHFAQWSSAQYRTGHTLISYEDDPVSVRRPGFDGVAPADATVLADQKFGAFLTYLTHDPLLMFSLFSSCSSGGSCSVGKGIALWIQREHVVGITQTASG